MTIDETKNIAARIDDRQGLAVMLACSIVDASDEAACMRMLDRLESLASLEMNDAIGNVCGARGQQLFCELIRTIASTPVNAAVQLAPAVRARLVALKANASSMTEVR